MARSVEKRAATVEEATEAGLRELGLRPEDAIVDVLSEGRRGIFGGGRRAQVRVTERADVMEATGGDTHGATGVVADEASEEDGVSDTDTTTAEDGPTVEEENLPVEPTPTATDTEELSPDERLDLLDEEAELAADFIEGLLDRLDLPGDIEIEVQESQAFVNVTEVGSGLLIGRRGMTLDALQELVRSATQRRTERRSHVRVDVEGYRARQLEKLRDKCRDAIAQVRETGDPVRLESMDAYERKMMHDLIAKTGGVTSSSEGNEPKRRVVIHPSE